MVRREFCRVWYRRWGIPQSFTEIGNFYEATTFAALIAADRIEVVREPLPTLLCGRFSRLHEWRV